MVAIGPTARMHPPMPNLHPTWSLKFKAGPTGQASKAGAQKLPRALFARGLGWALE